MEQTTTPRQSAGRINVLRRWDPASDEVIAYDLAQVEQIARRAATARPLTDTEIAVVLDALGRPCSPDRVPR